MGSSSLVPVVVLVVKEEATHVNSMVLGVAIGAHVANSPLA